MNPILANKTSLTPPRFIDQSDKWTVIYLCARDIEFASFYDFFVGFWSRSDSVVFFVFVLLYRTRHWPPLPEVVPGVE
jgi:hypothetical protein